MKISRRWLMKMVSNSNISHNLLTIISTHRESTDCGIVCASLPCVENKIFQKFIFILPPPRLFMPLLFTLRTLQPRNNAKDFVAYTRFSLLKCAVKCTCFHFRESRVIKQVVKALFEPLHSVAVHWSNWIARSIWPYIILNDNKTAQTSATKTLFPSTCERAKEAIIYWV